MSSKPKSSSFRTRSFKQLFKRRSSRKKSLGRKHSSVADTEKHVSLLSIGWQTVWISSYHGVNLLQCSTSIQFLGKLHVGRKPLLKWLERFFCVAGLICFALA